MGGELGVILGHAACCEMIKKDSGVTLRTVPDARELFLSYYLSIDCEVISRRWGGMFAY